MRVISSEDVFRRSHVAGFGLAEANWAAIKLCFGTRALLTLVANYLTYESSVESAWCSACPALN